MISRSSPKDRFRMQAGLLLFLWTFFAMGLILGGCSSVKERQDRALDVLTKIKTTGSGAVRATKTAVKNVDAAVKDAKAVVEDVNKRVNDVKTGIEKIQEGKAYIEAGIKGGTGSAK